LPPFSIRLFVDDPLSQATIFQATLVVIPSIARDLQFFEFPEKYRFLVASAPRNDKAMGIVSGRRAQARTLAPTSPENDIIDAHVQTSPKGA
jgi:hypothetical protein